MQQFLESVFHLGPKQTQWLSLALIAVLALSLRLILTKLILKKSKRFAPLFRFILDWSLLLALIYAASNRVEGLQFLNATLFSFGNTPINIFGIASALLFIMLANQFAEMLNQHLMPGLYRKYAMDKGSGYTLSRLIHYGILLIAVLTALGTLGINFTSLSVFGSLFGVGLGFGLQNIASNFISGLILLFEKNVKVGDRVTINGIIGDVVDIKMRATILKALNNEHIIIPNSEILNKSISSHSYGDLRLCLAITVGVSYDSDIPLAKKALLLAADEVAHQNPTVLNDPPPKVAFKAIGQSSLELVVLCWIEDALQEYAVKSALNESIVTQLRRHGIEMPYPRQDLSIRNAPAMKTEQNPQA